MKSRAARLLECVNSNKKANTVKTVSESTDSGREFILVSLSNIEHRLDKFKDMVRNPEHDGKSFMKMLGFLQQDVESLEDLLRESINSDFSVD